MSIFETTGMSIAQPLIDLVGSVLRSVPNIIGAILVLLVGYFVALFVQWLVVKFCTKLKLDNFLEKINVKRAIGGLQLTPLLGLVVKWYTFILFLPSAANVVSERMSPLADFLVSVAEWVPNLIAAALVALFGFIVAEYVYRQILSTKASSAQVVADITKLIIIVFTLLIVLRQAGLQVAIAETSFLIVLAGVMLALSLALGIGFGLALKDEAKPIIKDLKKKF